jgi:PrtD family type I secretion system ABC transporter
VRHFLIRCHYYFLFAGIFSLFINTLYLTFPLYMLGVYVRVLDSYSMSTLAGLTFLALSALLVLGLLDFIRSRVLVKLGIRLDRLLSRRVLKTMLADLCRADTQGYNQGLSDVNTVRNYFAGNAVFAFFDVPWIFIYLWVIYLVHPLLGMTAAAGGVVLLIVGVLQTLTTRKDQEAVNETRNMGRDFLNRSFHSAQVITTLGMTESMAGHMHRISGRADQNRERSGSRSHGFTAVSVSFRAMMQVIIFGVGAALVVANEAHSGVIIAASIIMGRALAPIDQAIGAWRQTAGAMSAYQNLNQLLGTRIERDTVQAGDLDGDLVVSGAGLALNTTPVLSEVDFTLKKGELLGLVGHNGAGKTCLCRMILGMWAPTEGSVTLAGKEMIHLDPEAYGPFVGYLPQGVELFPGTVSQNIARLGDVDSRQVVEAASLAGAHETILRFPMGYETDIGEAGQALSGGQRQLVGLARALYGSPGLVILDEPNSNLDEAGEKALVQALAKLRQSGTTTIMITHKPDLLSHMDKILVLKQGRVQAFGSKDEVFDSFINPQSPDGTDPDDTGPGGSAGGGIVKQLRKN